MNTLPVYTIWFTGLPSSGKSTIAALLAKRLKKHKIPIEILDGDVIRKYLWSNLGFTKKDRIINLKRTVFLAKLLTRNGIFTIVSFVSPYRSVRLYARRQLKCFIEVYIKCPIEICIKRDVKGLYKKALKGELSNFTGVSHPYEEPEKPEITIETNKLIPEESVKKITEFLKRRLTSLVEY